MSVNELEDFKRFLEKTSHLDQILVKKGHSPDDDPDQDENDISDDAWEQSGKFEGDLILNDRQRRVIVENVAEGLSRNGLKDHTKRWPDNELVYYIQREHFTSDQVQAIQDGIDDLAQASCVKFRPYRKGDRDAVVIQGSRRGCFSNVGYQGGYQVLNLNARHPTGRGCFRHGTIVHELLHSLGFYHMQSSPDRDDYIDVKWENIHEPARHNFRKYNTFSVSDFGVGYDYDSVLHYGRRAFSRNGQDTLVPKQGGASIGQRIRLSDKDVQKLNKMYCDADSNSFDAADEPAQKPANKKDKPKNKPFQGHGIGYHQVKPRKALKDYSKPDPYKGADRDSDVKQKEYQSYGTYDSDKPNAQDKDTEKVLHNDDSGKNNFSKSEDIDHGRIHSIPDNPEVHDKTDQNDSNVSDVVDEAFERLGKIIKTHVYPSQKPDLEVYKTKLDYNTFYNPEKSLDSQSGNIKADKSFNPAISTAQDDSSSDNRSNHKEEHLGTSEFPIKEKSSIYKSSELPYSDHIPRGFDSSYGTAYPFNRKPNIVEAEKFVTPEYATHKHLAHKHDYSGLYNPEHANKEKPNVLGYIVPLHDKFIQDLHKDNEKYNAHSYTNGESYDNTPSKLIQYDRDQSKEKPSKRKGYSLFGVLVPLTQKWYKVDYDPHSGSYSIETPESSEDYR
ncbi:astacin (Peptidase family m12A) domain-containing protein [Phthorimaea operculella]|nr:astacin (Peptidase family m12A) domain-containing protein [Phthorimaea operculella]